jgi:nucleotide-binding universal stress UspA family protein
MSLFRRILAPTDFSATAETALRYAVELAAEQGALLRVLHVLEDPRLPVSGRGEDLERETASLQAWVDARIAKEDRPRLNLEIRVVRGYPAFAIPRHALQEDFDVIVMGTHGRGDLAHTPWGSVAEKVVASSVCPVLTIRHARQRDVARERLTAHAAAGGDAG